MTSSIGIMKEKGKYHDDKGRSYRKVTLEQIEQEEANEYAHLDRLYEAGECDFDNLPKNVWAMLYYRMNAMTKKVFTPQQGPRNLVNSVFQWSRERPVVSPERAPDKRGGGNNESLRQGL